MKDLSFTITRDQSGRDHVAFHKKPPNCSEFLDKLEDFLNQTLGEDWQMLSINEGDGGVDLKLIAWNFEDEEEF